MRIDGLESSINRSSNCNGVSVDDFLSFFLAINLHVLFTEKLFMSKVRVESKWYHESPDFNLVAVDALNVMNEYVKVALFELTTHHAPLEDAAVKVNNKYVLPAPPSHQYSVDIG